MWHQPSSSTCALGTQNATRSCPDHQAGVPTSSWRRAGSRPAAKLRAQGHTSGLQPATGNSDSEDGLTEARSTHEHEPPSQGMHRHIWHTLWLRHWLEGTPAILLEMDSALLLCYGGKAAILLEMDNALLLCYGGKVRLQQAYSVSSLRSALWSSERASKGISSLGGKQMRHGLQFIPRQPRITEHRSVATTPRIAEQRGGETLAAAPCPSAIEDEHHGGCGRGSLCFCTMAIAGNFDQTLRGGPYLVGWGAFLWAVVVVFFLPHLSKKKRLPIFRLHTRMSLKKYPFGTAPPDPRL
jgi:hypothetical protein